MRRLRDSAGLTLVELAVAILILSIGTLAALRSLETSTNTARGSEARILAQIAVRNRAEELRLYGADVMLPTTVNLGGQTMILTEERVATAGGLVRVTVVAQVSGAAGALLVVYVPPGPPQ